MQSCLLETKPYNLACLFGNILDNAIEGISDVQEKHIELYFRRENDNRIILCQNTISHSVLKTNPSLTSTKPHKEKHGLGHKIIEKVIADYNGFVTYYEENGMFGMQIILPMPLVQKNVEH